MKAHRDENFVPTMLAVSSSDTTTPVELWADPTTHRLLVDLPAAGGVTDGDKGDITVSGAGTTWTIDAGVVTLAKMANMATASLIYRKTAGAGVPEVNTLATLKTDLGLTGTNSGDQTITLTGDVTGSGTTSFAATIANNAVSLAKFVAATQASILLGRQSGSAGNFQEITLGSGLQMIGTEISVSTSGTYVDISAYDYIISRSGGNTIAVKTSDGTTLSTNTDAAIPIQAAIDALDASSGTGGRIYVRPGTYALASSPTIQGDNTSDSKGVSLHGAGPQAVIFAPAAGVNGITWSNRAKVSLSGFAVYVRTTSDGLKCTNSSVGQRANWQSEIKNIYIYGDNSDHTGWGFNGENFFRSTVENLEMNQVGNGMLLKAIDTSTNYNPGDCTFTRMFIELRNRAGGVAYQINSPSTGDMNQMVFTMCEGYGGGTGQTGILLDGASGAVNHTLWQGINLENFDTILDIESGRGNVFDFNYIVTRDSAGPHTYFKTTSSALQNRISCKYLDTYTRSVVIINDANNNLNEPNVFEKTHTTGSATTATYTTVAATIIRDWRDDTLGTNQYIDVAKATLQDPGADRLYFWDDSTSRTGMLTPGGGFNITTTALSLDKDILIRVLDAATDNATGIGIGGDFEMPFAGTITAIGAYVDVAGTTGTMTIDVNKNGTTVMSATKITIDTTEKSSRTAAVAPVLTTTALAAGDLVTIDVDAIHTTPAKGLTVRLTVRQT